MRNTYSNCSNLTGSPVCGEYVIDMNYAYSNCSNITGSPICGKSVGTMNHAYYGCVNLSSNGYFYSNYIYDVNGCFGYRTTLNRINLYVSSNSKTLNTCLCNNTASMVCGKITWTDDTATNGCYYNTQYNIYIYPVENVAAARAANGD
jgi:hypothetical protein